jgi:hypothetical protein
MREHDFDMFLGAMRSSLMAAQEGARRQYEAAVLALVTADAGGGTTGEVIEFLVPSGPAQAQEWQSVGVPLSSLKHNCFHQISELSLEFDCQLRERPDPDRPGQTRLEMTTESRWWLFKRKPHRVKITFTGTQMPEGTVTIDGVVLKAIPAAGND